MWQRIETAPKDGTAVFGFGIHDHSPEIAQRGVKPGDFWWAIMLWDVFRREQKWVFAKDGDDVWSPPLYWQPIEAPIKFDMEPAAPEGTVVFEHVPLAEIDFTQVDLNGAALTPVALAWIEELIAPLAKVVTHIDLMVRRVSVQHLRRDGEQAQGDEPAVSVEYLLEAQTAFSRSGCKDWEAFYEGYRARDRIMVVAITEEMARAFGDGRRGARNARERREMVGVMGGWRDSVNPASIDSAHELVIDTARQVAWELHGRPAGERLSDAEVSLLNAVSLLEGHKKTPWEGLP